MPQAPYVTQGPSVTLVGYDLVGVTEIATMLGVTTQRVSQLVRTPAFPKPVAQLAAGLIWERSDVEQWARDTGRI
jgi:predicted DNA-binding transcriptional regulator AlpA